MILVVYINIMYRALNFLLDFIFNIEINRNIDNIASIKVKGTDNIFIKHSLGVVNAFHILFNNSMIFYNLHKFLFIFRSNTTKCIIIKIHS